MKNLALKTENNFLVPYGYFTDVGQLFSQIEIQNSEWSIRSAIITLLQLTNLTLQQSLLCTDCLVVHEVEEE